MKHMISLESKKIQWGCGLALAALAMASPLTSSAAELNPNNPLNPPSPIYWCPDKIPDQQYWAHQAPGCLPLLDEVDKRRAAERKEAGEFKASPPIKIQSIQREVSKFLQQYRQFLECCASDVASLQDLEELQDQAFSLLKAIQEDGLLNMGTNYRQFTASELIRPVAKARDDLRNLKVRLEQLGKSMERLDSLDYETASREAQKIQAEQESIKKEFQTKRPVDSPRTGMEIEDTTLPNRFGTELGGGNTPPTTLPNAFGPDIGYVTSPNSDQQVDLHPRKGPDIQDTTLPNRIGPELGGGNTPPTTLPNSFGVEIDMKENPGGSSTTPSRVGPSIGDSTLNRRP